MGAVQTRLVQLGLAVQTAKGTAATSPAHVVGLKGGKVYDVELEESELDTTWNNRVLAGFDRTQGIPVSDATLVAMPKSVGALLKAAMGAYAVTGASAPYTHTFTVGDALPYVTLWGKYGSADSARIVDAKVDDFEFTFEKSGAAEVHAKLVGCGTDLSIAFPTPGAGVEETVSAGVLKGMGGTFTVDGAAARVTGGSIKISNGLEPIVPAYAVVPEDIFEARSAIEVSLKVKPSDLTTWRKIVTGSTSGSAVSANVLYGALAMGFTGPGGSTLNFTAPSVAYSTSMPDADPNGGAAELTITGRVVIPATGSPLTAVLVNSVATY
jgi:hypothetical protein